MTYRPTSADVATGIRERAKALPRPGNPDSCLSIAFVQVSDITVDPAYQRRISKGGLSKIQKMVLAFDWARFGALTLARSSDGTLYVIDGQHRLVAASAVRAETVPAVIVETDQRKQAEDFVAINTVRTSVASIDKFRARVASGDGVAVKVAEMLANLDINTDVPAGASLRPKDTRAVSTLEKLQRAHGAGVVFTTLETMIQAQPGQDNLLTAFAIEATAEVVARMLAAERSLDRLDTVLADTDFETLKEEASQLVKLTGGRTARRGAELLLQRVNKGLREKVA